MAAEAGMAGAWRRHLAPGVDLQRALAGLTRGSLPEALGAAAASAPERLALEIDGEAVTHGELDRRAALVGGWLQARGIRPGERVLLSSASSVRLVACYLGALRTGAVAVLASPALTALELRHLVRDAAVRAAFVSEAPRRALGEVAADTPSLETVVPIGGDGGGRGGRGGHGGHGGDGGDGFLDALAHSEPLGARPLDPDAPALLAYTSGTTGTPKGVPLTHANLLASIRAVMLAWRWSAGDVLVHALPLAHQHGLGGLHAALLAGARAALLSRFEPRRLAALAAATRATVLFAVPTMYERLLTVPEAELAPLRRLRLAVSGSAPLSAELATRAGRALGQLPLERYGTTESGLDVSNLYWARRPGAVGFALPGVELRIADRHGAALEDGRDGEVLVRGPQVFSGYLGLPEATAEAFHGGGWFRTGDVGRIDPDSGHLVLSGRIKEVIITGGLNVYPREVEQALEQHPTVAEAAVAGLPSERWGEQVTAWVVPVPGATIEVADLLAHARGRLAPYKCPKQVRVVAGLPRNSMGKLMRRRLAGLL